MQVGGVDTLEDWLGPSRGLSEAFILHLVHDLQAISRRAQYLK